MRKLILNKLDILGNSIPTIINKDHIESMKIREGILNNTIKKYTLEIRTISGEKFIEDFETINLLYSYINDILEEEFLTISETDSNEEETTEETTDTM